MRKGKYINLTSDEKAQLRIWEDLCERIDNYTKFETVEETEAQKERRLKRLKGNFVAFAEYYFPHYIDSKFGWFHKKAAKEIEKDKNCFAILEWAREHAKSVFADVMMPMWLYAKGELSGMILVSANQDKAKTLLADLQAEFVSNFRWKHDFGELAQKGHWQEGKFATAEGIGFWAFGRGQSARGVRKAAHRPNYAVIDDIDDNIICRNELRVNEIVDWIIEDIYGACSIKGARLIIAGNRIHKKSILAKMVGDVEPKDPKREGIVHIKVYAFENPKTHKKADPTVGTPAWKERYTAKQLSDKMLKMGFRSSRREYFHEHHEVGLVFQNEWVLWKKAFPIHKYDAVVVYTDPSFKETKKSDYKATVVIGKKGKELHVIRAWVRQTSPTAMVQHIYDLWEEFENHARYYMEANFLQDLLLDEFTEEGERRGYQMPIRADKRKKENKEVRIENLAPLWERKFWYFNEKQRQDPDMQTLINQFMGFPFGNDDGPDACEGAVYILQGIGRSQNFPTRMGKFRKSRER